MLARTVWKPSTEAVNLTVTQTATLLSALVAIPSDARRVLIQVESANIRERGDGTAPVGGVGGGYFMQAGQDYIFEGYDYMAAMKLIRDESTNAIINVQFSKAE